MSEANESTTGAPFGNYQLEIYRRGATSKVAQVPFSFTELERQRS